jgi:pimeloyl-ACP methyl ester carboxylesterase
MATVDVSVLGEGPAILLPVGTAVIEGEAAEQMRAWGVDPSSGHTLATSLVDAGFTVVSADYESHLSRHPQTLTLTADGLADGLLGIADAADVDRFVYYGYSWLALAGLQLAIRSDRVTALAMGGFPPLSGPYDAMLTVTRATYRMAVANRDNPPPPVDLQSGDWDSSEVTLTPEQAQQYLTLYESLHGFDERAALKRLTIPRLAFAGANDNITYGPRWDDAHVAIAEPLTAHREELIELGWTVELIPDSDHMTAMQAANVLPVLLPWLRRYAIGR